MPVPRYDDPLNQAALKKLREAGWSHDLRNPPLLELASQALEENPGLPDHVLPDLEEHLNQLLFLAQQSPSGRKEALELVSRNENGDPVLRPSDLRGKSPLESGQLVLRNLHDRLSVLLEDVYPPQNPHHLPRF